MEIYQEIETALLAVKNNHISFLSLTKKLPKREVKNYLIGAIQDKLEPLHIGEDELEFYPYDLQFYAKHYKQFKEWYFEDYPEVWI